MSNKRIENGENPVPEPVRFYAELCCEDDDYAPIAVHALDGLQSHFEDLVYILDEIREPRTNIEYVQRRILRGYQISLQRLAKDMKVIRDYARESLANDPWIVQRVIPQQTTRTAVNNQDAETHPVQ